METSNRIKILDVPVDMVNSKQALAIFAELMEEEGLSLIVTPNSEIIVNAGKDADLKEVISAADLVIPDGIGLVYASRILGCPLEERVTGFDFLTDILGWLAEHGKSVFLLGSKPGEGEMPDIAEFAAAKMQKRFPGLKIAGVHHGYFKADEEETLVAEINASGADFLCVAMGAPKQEKFIWNHRRELTPRAAIGVGGSLDVWAGAVKRAPEFYQKHGLEWLYRLIKQPSRYKRMAALPLFMARVVRDKRSMGTKE